MSRALSPTRLELKRQREALARYERFLPALRRKEQRLQLAVQETRASREAVRRRLAGAEVEVAAWAPVLGDPAGVDVAALALPAQVVTADENVAGVRVSTFVEVTFTHPEYSLFGSPAWLERAIAELRIVAGLRAELEVLERREERLARELRRVLQRVNLFEKVRIPRARDAVRRIRIHLGDEMSAAVGRAKLAKRRVAASGVGGGA